MRKIFAVLILSAMIAGPAFAVDPDVMDAKQEIQADQEEFQTDEQKLQAKQKLQAAKAKTAIRKARMKKAAQKTPSSN